LFDRPAGECACQQYQEDDTSDDKRILQDLGPPTERSRCVL
jgi:hypothetical protein